METAALVLSFKLALATLVILLPFSLAAARALATWRSPLKPWVEGLAALPLVLPPTVVGYYLLVAFGMRSPLGQWFAELTGHPLAFSFAGLVVASVLFNIPFALTPIQRAFESIDREVREAAKCCGLSSWQAFCRIELPLAWPGILSATVLTFAHTLGEFGVVLMVGGNIPGETQTIAIAIYDRVQAFDDATAARLSALLVAISLATIAIAYGLAERWLKARRTWA